MPNKPNSPAKGKGITKTIVKKNASSAICPLNLSFASDIVVLFTPDEISCMKNNGIDLSNYSAVVANAPGILTAVTPTDPNTPPIMPMGLPAWTPDMVATFACWMQQGFKP
jgi:hypothetical protein